VTRRPRALLLAGTLFALAACTDPGARAAADGSPSPPAVLKIAYLENLAPEGAFERVVPAFYGAKLALDQALASGDLPVTVEVVPQDIGDPARMAEVLAEDAADPTFIGAMVSPFWSEPRPVGERLSAAGIPTFSLSTVNPDAATSWRSWYAAVAPLQDQAAKVAGWLGATKNARDGVCVATDGAGYGEAFAREVERMPSVHVVDRSTIPSMEAMPVSVMRGIRASGCGAMVYGGFGSDGGVIRIELDAAGLSHVHLVGSDSIQDHTFLELTGPSGDGTVASCSCVDLGASPSLSGQQFIHDYQSEYGTAPAAYAVEGWDVARMFASVIHSGARTRSSVAGAIASRDSFEGLAHPYAFTRSGALAPSARSVVLSEANGGRWLSIGSGS
jgi:branched-chain amino acid transport system substrate-binding protein